MFEIPEEMRRARQAFSLGNERSDVGVLCLHGFTGSPAEMRPLGAHLARQGFFAKAPVLPRHGGMSHELKGTKWRQWANAAQDALNHLAGRCERVFIAGLSMGGLLTLHLAACECYRAPAEGRRTPIRGIIVMAAPAAINDSRARLVRFARFVMPYHYPLKGLNFNDERVRTDLRRRMGDEKVNFDDPNVQKAIVRGMRIPLDAIHELIQFNAVVMRELPHVTVPALFIQGRQDRTVAPDSAEAIAARVGSKDKHVIWYERSGHELPLEPDAPEMFEEISAFIRAHI
jgi:carboxylesterase